MPIDEKPAAAWNEDDLQELIGRRETPKREFKQELLLATDRQKRDAEEDVQGMANAGGGFLIYGIQEQPQVDGSRIAVALTSLADGALYEQLNNVLDARGDPRVPFDLYAIDAADGGIYLVVEVYGRRRPHMANDGRYYVRRNLLVRQMTEAEVADAYRDRFIRERALAEGDRPDVGQADEVDLIDPMELNEFSFHAINMDDRWRQIEPPLQHFGFQRTLQGFRAQLPPRDDTYPYYLFHFWPDGVLEFGTLLESVFRDDEPRRIPSLAMAEYVHDSLVLFARIYRLVGYEDQVRAAARLDHVAGYQLAVDQQRVGRLRPIQDESIAAVPFEGTVAELEEFGADAVARDLANRVFVSAGAGHPYFFDAQGNYTG
jgi:hypothetical protein